MGSSKPSGIINKSEPKPLLTNAHESGNLADGNAMWGNRLIVPSCEKKNSIKGKRRVPPSDRQGISMYCSQRRRKRRRQQRGGILPLLLPAVAAAIIMMRKKKKVGKTTAAQWAANQRRVRRMLGRTGWGGFETLRRLSKKRLVGNKTPIEDGPWTQWTPTSLCPPKATSSTRSATRR